MTARLVATASQTVGPFFHVGPGAKGEFELFSYGRDGKAGGSGDDADVGLGAATSEVSLNK